jgi:riboflavin kinase/FMN adenylyltransferase
MKTIYKLEDSPTLPPPIALTIGVFDGVHAGHRFLLQEMKKRGTTTVLTFSNHPFETLHGKSISFLCPLEERLERLETAGVDLAIVLNFTKEFADQPYDTFLKNVQKHLPFSFLVLGEGASFGKGNFGTESRIRKLDLGFEAIYLKKQTHEGAPISSKRIRDLLAQGEEQKALNLL